VDSLLPLGTGLRSTRQRITRERALRKFEILAELA